MTETPGPPASNSEGRPEPDFSGRRLGDYQLLRRLGRGGMAEVYLAEQISLQRQVALKVLKQNLAGDSAYIRRFQHEAQAAAKLVHANIVQIFEVGCVEGTYYISQEYVRGQNLRQLLARLPGGVDAVTAANVIWQVASALHKAGEEKIIHRDVKPENIMISPDNEVKVADFGLARVVRDGEALNLTQVGITMGTPLYMSPEQVEGRSVDSRSDLYSFGVTCYHMLAGHLPFDGETALAVAVQHLKNEPKRLEVLRPDLPEGLCRVVHKLLAKKPEERYQRAIDLLKDVRQLNIEGMNRDWAADLPGFHSGNQALSMVGRTELTQQLEAALIGRQLQSSRRWSLVSMVGFGLALLVVGLALGGTLAWINRAPPLLPLPQNEAATIPRQSTVQDQYSYAQFAQHNKEKAWQAVAEYFPPEQSAANRRYARLAQRELGNFYLSNRRLEDALKLYDELENVEDAEVNFKLSGTAGVAVVQNRLKETEGDAKRAESREQEVIQRLVKLRSHETDLDAKVGGFLGSEVRKLFNEYEPEGT